MADEKSTEQPTSSTSPDQQQSDQRQTEKADTAATEARNETQTEAQEGGLLEARLAELEADLARARDAEIRAIADQENTRRRAEQEVQKAHRFGLEKLMNELLPVVDNLERALQSMRGKDQADLSAVFEGIELTHKEFLATLEKHGVQRVDPVGEPFNPQWHQAISAVPSAEVEPNTVLEVIQQGYMLHERLLRPALVVVSKPTS